MKHPKIHPKELKQTREEAGKLGAMAALVAVTKDKTSAYKHIFPEKTVGQSDTQISRRVTSLYNDNDFLKDCERMCLLMLGELASTNVETAIKKSFENLEKMTKSYEKTGKIWKLLGKTLDDLEKFDEELLMWVKTVGVKPDKESGQYYITSIDLKNDLPYTRLAWEVGQDIAERMYQREAQQDNAVKVEKAVVVNEVPNPPQENIGKN